MTLPDPLDEMRRQRDEWMRRFDRYAGAESVTIEAMRPMVEAAKAYVEAWHGLNGYTDGDNLGALADAQHLSRAALVAAVDQLGQAATVEDTKRPSLECMCAQVDVGYRGFHEYVLGRKDPRCPYHGRQRSTEPEAGSMGG